MKVILDDKYERSKKKIAKRIGLDKIIETENRFKKDLLDKNLQYKSINCQKDKTKKSIRVIGNSGYRILITIIDDIYYFQDIMNHDKYDRITKNC